MAWVAVASMGAQVCIGTWGLGIVIAVVPTAATFLAWAPAAAGCWLLLCVAAARRAAPLAATATTGRALRAAPA